MSEQVLKAFYHTSRRACLPWTASELARRTGMSLDEVGPILKGLAIRGLVSAAKHGQTANPTAWELTESGKVQARAIVAAEIMARSV